MGIHPSIPGISKKQNTRDRKQKAHGPFSCVCQRAFLFIAETFAIIASITLEKRWTQFIYLFVARNGNDGVGVSEHHRKEDQQPTAKTQKRLYTILARGTKSNSINVSFFGMQ